MVKRFEYLIVTIDMGGSYVTGTLKETCDRHHIDGENCPGYHYVREWAHIDVLGADGWGLVSINFECETEAVAFFRRDEAAGL